MCGAFAGKRGAPRRCSAGVDAAAPWEDDPFFWQWKWDTDGFY